MSDGPLGTKIHLPVTYTDAAGVLTDPSPAPVLTIDLPDGTSVTPAVTHDSTGKYHVDYLTVQEGHHSWSYTSNLGGVGDVFNISGQQPTALVSLTAAKLHINYSATDTTDDAEMRDVLLSATDMVNSACGASVKKTVTEVVPCQVSGTPSLILTEWPVLTVDTITPLLSWAPAVDVANLVASDSGICTLTTGQLFYGPTQVAYTVGRSVIPDDLQELCLLLFGWMWETQRGAATAGVAGFSDEAEGGRYPRPLPARAEYIMRQYVRPNV